MGQDSPAKLSHSGCLLQSVPPWDNIAWHCCPIGITLSYMKVHIGETDIEVKKGDITQEQVDAIVNAANSRLVGGGGVDGAIHRAGGPEIMRELDRIREKQGGCLTGHAVLTTAGRLKARWVIHAVGPIYRAGSPREAALLADAYRNSLRLAAEAGARSIAFPSISTGAYGYPIEKASKIALKTTVDWVGQNPVLRQIRFVLFSDHDLDVYRRTLAPLIPTRRT